MKTRIESWPLPHATSGFAWVSVTYLSGAVFTPTSVVVIDQMPSMTVYRTVAGRRKWERLDTHEASRRPSERAVRARALAFAKAVSTERGRRALAKKAKS